MYRIFLKANENLRTEIYKCNSLQECEDWLRNKANWNKFQINTPEGIKEAVDMGFNPF